MKQKITITTNDTVIYQGRISDLPIKEDAIISKSIELFDDEDPCIIHQSYVIKEYIDELLTLFNNQGTTSIDLKDVLDFVSFLDIEDLEHTTIRLEG
jgi:hypothetical protein